jgi:hypothetical protein
VQRDDAGRDLAREGQGGEFGALRLAQGRRGEAVRRAELARLRHLPVVVAAHRDRPERVEPREGLGGPERAGHAVAEVDDGVDPLARDLGEHGLDREHIPVDVGDDGESHEAAMLSI